MTVQMIVDSHLPIVKSIAWPDEAATQVFAAQLAAKPAVRRAVIELQGDLGAGKTTFARHLLTSLGVQGRIKSPTYAVVETYVLLPENAADANQAAAGLSISHFDFYRFNDPNEWEEAGFRELFANPGLKLVEWAEKAGDHLPQADLVIHIDMLADDSRAVIVTAHTPTGVELLA